MDLILALGLIAGGALAAAGLIVSKNPKAGELIAKLQPFQAIIGIGLLVVGILNLLSAGFGFLFHPLILGLFSLSIWLELVSAVLLGIMFGMPILARLSAGGAAKGAELGKKLAPFQTIIGLVAIGSAVLYLLYRFGILHPSIMGM
jgi:hypothetical protein